MALTERIEIGVIEIVAPWKLIQVREDTVIEKDGKEISRSFNRFIIKPGDDHDGLDPDVRAVAELLHTSEHIEKYKKYRASLEEVE